MFKEKFAKRLKELRKSRKLTQENLAEMVGIDFRYISLIENGKSFPSCTLIEKLACALNVSYKEMFDFEDEITRNQIEQNIINLFKILDDKSLKILYNFTKNLL